MGQLFSRLGATLLLVTATEAAFADQALVLEVEQVATPGWIVEETEKAVEEGRAAVYNEDQFLYYQDDSKDSAKDEDEIVFPLDDEDEIPPLQLPQEKPKDAKAKTPRKIPSMSPDGGVRDIKPKKKTEAGKDGSSDPFPPLGDDDPFPPGGDDPFPPGSDDPFPDDPIPGLPGDNDPFPPITDPINDGFPGFGDPFFPDPGFGSGYGPVAVIDQIVNLGHKVWKIIEANQPVIKAEYKYANAIPSGTVATDLEYFSPVQYKSFRIKLKNRFDSDVVDITYTTVHRFGGKYEGNGHFLERVSIVPSKVIAGYNYKINFNVTNVTVANVGSKEDPIASMGVDALIEYGSTFKKTSRRIMFEFRGDSEEVKQYRVD